MVPGDRSTAALRAFTAGLGAETNTFSTLSIDLDAFRQTFLYRPGEHPEALTEVSAPLQVLRRRRDRWGWQLVEGTYAFALPAGRVDGDVYEALRDEILDQLRAAGPVDLVALSLHGAMCATGYDDCEGDLLSRVREIVGPGTPIGAELDPHAHLSEDMVRCADVLVAFKEYPHTDFLERGEELIDLLERCARSGWRPAKGVFDCRMIGRFHTTREPMKQFVQTMIDCESSPGIASVSLIHGFPWADVADMGTKCLVLADEDTTANEVARRLGNRLLAIREQTFAPPLPLDEALASALARPDGRVVLADVSDNPGGGAAGDSVVVLERILEAGVPACLGPLWDPAAVAAAHDAGVGTRLRLRLGSRGGVGAGPPPELELEVTGLADEAWQTWAGTRMSLGRACALRCGRVEIAAVSIRDQAYGPDLFGAVQIDPLAHRLVVVKSAQHFAAGFAPIADAIVLAAGGGPLETDFRRIPYRHVRRPLWPLDPSPFDPEPPRTD